MNDLNPNFGHVGISFAVGNIPSLEIVKHHQRRDV